MIKRILSLALSVLLLLSVVNVAYAANDEFQEIKHQYSILTQLGVIYEENIQDYSAFRDMSKSSFINFICNIYGGYGFGAGHSEEAVSLAEGMGLIHKNQNDLYKPLNYNEAMTMLVRMMGYGYHAEQSGGFPTGYINIAQRIGLSRGLEGRSGETLQEYDAIRLLYNMINCPYVDIVSITDTDIGYGGASDHTVLYEFRKIYKVEGILQSSGYSSIGKEIIPEVGRVMINGYVYETDEDFTEYLGMNVEAYIQETKDADRVLVMTPFRNEEVIIHSSEIVGMANRFTTFKYYENNKERSFAVSPIAAVIYNGQPKACDEDDFKPMDGYIRFIENNNTTGYDAVFITDYKTVVVESTSKTTFNVKNTYTKVGGDLNLKQENDEDIIRITDGENQLSFRDIATGDILKVEESVFNGKKMINIRLSRQKIGGIVTTVRKGTKTVVTVDGKDYVLAPAFEAALKKADPKALNIQSGRNYNFYLDSDGYIAFAKEMDGVLRYGLVMDTDVDGTFEDVCRIRLFTTEGQWKTLEFAKKIDFVDANGIETRPNAKNILSSIDKADDGKISVIAYMTNAKGLVTRIELPSKVADADALLKISEDDSFNYYTSTNFYTPNNTSFRSEVFIEPDAAIWFIKVPETTETDPNKRTQMLRNEENYSLRTISSLGIDKTHIFHAYSLDRFAFADLFVIEETPTLQREVMGNSDVMVVDTAFKSMNAEGEVISAVTGIMGSYDEITYYSEKEDLFDGLGMGDVITLHTDSLGYVDSVEVLYSVASGKTAYTQDSYANINLANTKLQGTVELISIPDNRMRINCGGEGQFKSWNIRTALNDTVIVCDLKAETISRGSIADVEEKDFVVIRMNKQKISPMVVYKENNNN